MAKCEYCKPNDPCFACGVEETLNKKKKSKFLCRLCGKNNGGEFAVGICEPCSDEVTA